jgi:hypothetical protein
MAIGQRLGHVLALAVEPRLEASRGCPSEAQSLVDLLHGKTEKLGGNRSPGKTSNNCRGKTPQVQFIPGTNSFSNPVMDIVPQNDRSDIRFARGLLPFRYGETCCEGHSRRMTAYADRGDFIELVSMNKGAIGQSGVHARSLKPAGDHGGLGHATKVPNRLDNNGT